MAADCRYTESIPDLDWSNINNKLFYENLTREYHDVFSQKSDLDASPDINSISNLVKNAHHIFEIGAGYGRVIDAARYINPKTKITGIEICKHMCCSLRKAYQKNHNIQIIQGNFINFDHHSINGIDLITIMWSTISTFNQLEHIYCLKKSYDSLIISGSLVIDSCFHNRDMAIKDGNYIANIKGLNHYGYMMPLNDIRAIAIEIGFKQVETQKYLTPNGIERYLTICTK